MVKSFCLQRDVFIGICRRGKLFVFSESILRIKRILLIFGLFSITFYASLAQKAGEKLVKSTSFKQAKVEFGVGGTVTIIGAPVGSIQIKGWGENQIEIEAKIEIQAENENDIAQIASVSGFLIDRDMTHVRVISVGTYDKDYIKRVAKKFPKRLVGLPLRIDYVIKVPAYCDLEVNGGKGEFAIEGVEGSVLIRFLESKARLNVSGGAIDATFGSGEVEVNVLSPSWRGRWLNVGLANGNMRVTLPQNMNAEISMSVLQNGRIENLTSSLRPRRSSDHIGEKSINTKLGNGGASMSFRVGNGNIKIAETIER
jgi:hypothetical protein